MNQRAPYPLRHNPAASFDFGAYCWSMGADPVEEFSTLTGPITPGFHFDPDTARFGHDHTEQAFDLYMESREFPNAPPVP